MMGRDGRSNDDPADTANRRSLPEFIYQLLHHDLTNHLLVIQGNVDVLEDEVTDARVTERLRTVERQTEAEFSLLRETKSLLNGTRGESLKFGDVGSTIETELGHLEAAYPDANVIVDATGDVTVPAPAFLGSVFSNLLRNAIEHNDANSPQVHVTVVVEGNTIELEIEDNGPGIPEAVRNNLTNTAARDDDGMGLYIVRSLIDEHDGTLAIDTGSRGTTITVELPVGDATEDPSPTLRFSNTREVDSIQHSIDKGESPSVAILRAVAAVSGRRIEDLDPLGQTVDTDAVDGLLQGGSDVCLEFQYEGYQITANPDDISIESLEAN